MDACPRPILELPTSVPANHYLDRLHDRYPYCSSIVLHQDKESKNWHLVDSLLPITFMNQSNKIDKNFMLRK
uniref:Uncharacterized protein n=1 Tax=Panagrolaimus sp. JU765 TaxID=591449 RepID=A0AC34QCE0_9BILA